LSHANEEVLAFVAEWFDPMPQLTKTYLLKFFPETHEVEMVDAKSRRLFLKRSKCPDTILKEEFFVGSQMVLYARHLSLVDYGDGKTRQLMAAKEAKTVAIISPDAYLQIGEILDQFLSSGQLALGKLKMVQLGPGDANDVCNVLRGELQGGQDQHVENLCSGLVVAALLVGDGACQTALQIQEGVRARLASGPVRCAVTCAADGSSATQLEHLFFSKDRTHPSPATFDNCTCCVVRPHAVIAGHTGKIIDHIIKQGYEVSALQLFKLERSMSEEFLEVYKGVVPEFPDMVEQLCSGACVAMEVRAENAVQTFRETAGPWDVEIAREIRPNTLRARFGKSRIMNAVHCTDLPEDGILESQYFFEVLQSSQY